MIDSFQFNLYKDEIGDVLFPGPSMLSREEAVFYYFLGRHYSTGAGNIVDAGCWLGSSSYYVAKGIERGNQRASRTKILSFDLFRWEKSSHVTEESKKLNLRHGDDFRETTREFLKSINLEHEVNQIDYSVPSGQAKYYNEDRPIEILLIDAGKSPDLLLNILEGYLPFTIENHTIVFFQDYRDYFCWFTPPVVEMLGEVIRPVKFLDAGGAAFVVSNLSRISHCIAEARERFRSSETEVARCYDQATHALREINLSAYFQMRANRVAMRLHFCKVTEVYFGPPNERKHFIEDDGAARSLVQYVHDLDREWPARVWDAPLVNAYRRVMHGISGRKDLTISFISPFYVKRRVLNMHYWSRALVNSLKRSGWLYGLVKELRREYAKVSRLWGL